MCVKLIFWNATCKNTSSLDFELATCNKLVMWTLKFCLSPSFTKRLEPDNRSTNHNHSFRAHWPYTDSPGCHQVAARDFQCQKFVVKIQKLLMFGELWQPLVSKVTWTGSPMLVRSWDPGVLCCYAHPRCCPANTVRDGQSKLEKGQFLVCGWGGAAPYDPH